MRAKAYSFAGIALVAWAGAASAELYRWIDPESGSIKITSHAPPWYSEGGPLRGGPPVEVIRSSFSPTVPDARRVGALPSPPKPAESRRESAPPAAGVEAQAGGGTMLEKLEAKRKELLRIFDAFPKATDFNSAGEGFGNHVKAYEAVSAELDRMDPKRAARRKAEEPSLLEKMRTGLRMQFSPTPIIPGESKK